MNRCINPFFGLMAIIGLVILTWPGYGWPEEEQEPTISLVQTLEVQEFEGLKFNANEYAVKRGDTLTKLLQERGVVKKGPLPDQLVRMIKQLNPELKNPDLLEIGQKVVLPTGLIEGLEASSATTTASKEKEPGAKAPTKADGVAEDGTEYVSIHVKSGDNLSKLLKEMGVPENKIFADAIALVLRLNPQIGDPNLIYAGATLRLPLKSDWAEVTIAGSEKILARKLPKTPPAATRSREPEMARVERKPTTIIVPPPSLPPSEHLATRTALGLIYTRIGETFVSKGKHFLPLPTGGQISLSAESFPIIELNSGYRIVLDLDQRLPQEMIEMIRTNYPNYSIFIPKRGESLPAMLTRLLKMSQFYRVQDNGQPLTLEPGIRIKLRADYIIWPSADDLAAGRAVAITMPSTPKGGTTPELAALLADYGIKIIDFYPKGNLIGPDLPSGASSKSLDVEPMHVGDVNDFVRNLLTLVKQKFESDLSIPLVKNGSQSQEFNFTVQAPTYFSRDGVNFVVSQDSLSSEVEQLLRNQKFKVITRRPGESPILFANRLLTDMGIPYEDGITISSTSRKTGPGVEVTLPGLLIKINGEETLLTWFDPPQDLAPLLTRPNLHMIRVMM